MARIFHQLLVLFSLLSSSFHFFLETAQAGRSPVSFRSRLLKLRDTQTLLIGQLGSVRDSKGQSELEVRTNGVRKDCQHGCDLYYSFSKTDNFPHSALTWGTSETYLKDWLVLNTPKNSEKYRDYSGLLQTTGNIQRLTDNGEGANSLSGGYENNDVKLVNAEISPLLSVLFQQIWEKFADLDTHSNTIRVESEEISDGFPLVKFSEFQEKTSQTEMEPVDESDWNKYFKSRDFEDSDTDQQINLYFEGNKNKHEKRETGEAIHWTDFEIHSQGKNYLLTLISLPKPESDDKSLYLQDFTGLSSRLPVSPPQRISATSLYAKTHAPFMETAPAGNPRGTRLTSLYSNRYIHSIERGPGINSEKTGEQTSRTEDASVSKRISGPFNPQVFVHGQDDRHRVLLSQMRKFPFTNIARLSTGCTGTLVTPSHVLTAAHCVHNGFVFRDNLEKLKIEISDTMGFKNYYAQKITIPTGWLRGNQSKVWSVGQSGKRAMYDYAVVHLTLAVAGRTRFLPLAVPRPEVLQMDFHFLAFPEDDQQLWRSVCLASQHMALGDGNLIMTRCDAAVGNSGAAVFIQDPYYGGLKVVGILSNTMHVGHHRSFLRYSIITALTWSKLTHICQELDALGQLYNVCPPERYMRRSSFPHQLELKVIPFFGKRAARDVARRPRVVRGHGGRPSL